MDNKTSAHYSFSSQWEKRMLTTSLSIIIFIAFLGNLIVVIVFWAYKPLRRITNVFTVSLALSDMMVGLVGMPLWIVNISCDCNQKELVSFYSAFLTAAFILIFVFGPWAFLFFSISIVSNYKQNFLTLLTMDIVCQNYSWWLKNTSSIILISNGSELWFSIYRLIMYFQPIFWGATMAILTLRPTHRAAGVASWGRDVK